MTRLAAVKAQPKTATRHDPADLVFAVTCDDEEWEINLSRFTGSDWLAMEKFRPNISFASVAQAFMVKQVTVIALALWAWRRKDEPKLTYDQVLDSLDAASVGELVKPDDEDDEAEEGDGEDEAGPPA